MTEDRFDQAFISNMLECPSWGVDQLILKPRPSAIKAVYRLDSALETHGLLATFFAEATRRVRDLHPAVSLSLLTLSYPLWEQPWRKEFYTSVSAFFYETMEEDCARKSLEGLEFMDTASLTNLLK